MFEEKPWQELLVTVKKYRVWLSWIGLVIGLVIFSGSLVYLFFVTNDESLPIITRSPATQPAQASAAFITVAITGAISRPGVYRLSDSSLLTDLVRRAGGFTDDANRLAIVQELNLASHLTDGQHIFIPTRGINQSHSTLNQESSQTGISINTASVEELETLVGIGEKRANDIIVGRPYQSVHELVSKQILTAAQLEKIGTQISL